MGQIEIESKGIRERFAMTKAGMPEYLRNRVAAMVAAHGEAYVNDVLLSVYAAAVGDTIEYAKAITDASLENGESADDFAHTVDHIYDAARAL